MKKLIVWLNEENKVLKEEGFTVDGKHYKANFKGCISDWIMLYITKLLLINLFRFGSYFIKLIFVNYHFTFIFFLVTFD